MITVAIHQPNYLPWLGYFSKMAQADLFIFLDDTQYTKNSYINRVQIDAGGKPGWMSVPVSYDFGDPINRVRPANPDWRKSHPDMLATRYRKASAFVEVHDWLGEKFKQMPTDDIAAGNKFLITELAKKLGIKCRFANASDFGSSSLFGDDRLIELVKAAGPETSYLSGKGGANYQDPAKFQVADIQLLYSEFTHPVYEQGHEFLPGLSIVDALFRAGFEHTAKLVLYNSSSA